MVENAILHQYLLNMIRATENMQYLTLFFMHYIDKILFTHNQVLLKSSLQIIP